MRRVLARVVHASRAGDRMSSRPDGDTDKEDSACSSGVHRRGDVALSYLGHLFPTPAHYTSVTALLFICLIVSFWERMGFSIAFTAIGNEMDLSETEKGSVFAAYYYGFAVTQIPGGYMAKRFGGKAVLSLSFLLWAPASALMGVLASRTKDVVEGIVACRLAIGMAQGVFIPAAQSTLGHWIPPKHRGRHFAFAMSGMYAGAAAAMATVPSLVSLCGSPCTFYVAAGLGLLRLAVWTFVGSDSPELPSKRQAKKVERSNQRLKAEGAKGTLNLEDGIGGETINDEWSAVGMASDDATLVPYAFRNPWSFNSDDRRRHHKSDDTAPACVTKSAKDRHRSLRMTSSITPDGKLAICVGNDSPAMPPGDPRSDSVSTGGGRHEEKESDAATQIVRANARSASDVEQRGCLEEEANDDEGWCRTDLATCAAGGSGLPGRKEDYSGSGSSSGAPAEKYTMAGTSQKEKCVASAVAGGCKASKALCKIKSTPCSLTTLREEVPRMQASVKAPFPWRAMLASPAAWACVAGNVGASAATNVLISWLPSYFENFITVNLEDIGLVAQLSPYIMMMSSSVFGGLMYCWLTNERGVSRAAASKVITGSAFAAALAVFLCMGLARTPATATLLSSLALASAALSRGGWSTNHVEIAAPEHAAILYSAANTASAAASVASISLTGNILDGLGGAVHARAWTAAMGAIGALCAACGTFYVAFAQADRMLFSAEVPAGEEPEHHAATGLGDKVRKAKKESKLDDQMAWPRPFGWLEDNPVSGAQTTISSMLAERAGEQEGGPRPNVCE